MPLVITSPSAAYRPGIATSCVVSITIDSPTAAARARLHGIPHRASPSPSGTNKNTFRIALTPPTGPQIKQKWPPVAVPGSGRSVVTAITPKLATTMTRPRPRSCGAGATVRFTGDLNRFDQIRETQANPLQLNQIASVNWRLRPTMRLAFELRAGTRADRGYCFGFLAFGIIEPHGSYIVARSRRLAS